MYLDHYHLKLKPFDLSPRPDFLWLGEKHDEALATLNYGIREDLGFLLLTGDVGVGKTALVYRLIKNLDASTIVAHITDPGLGTVDFFKLLAVEFNIPGEFHSKGSFLIELEKFLYAAYSDHKKVLLIVDEAQRLNNKLLDQIRVLSNIELSDRKLINIFFVGQPEFKSMLMANSNRAIRQRIAINYHIDPLTEQETGQYIGHRLKVAGATQKIFKSNAIREIFRFTGGYPRAINIICDHALLTGYASGIKTIDADVIKECEKELNLRAGFDFSRTAFQTSTDTARPGRPAPPPRRSTSRVSPILIGLLIVLSALAGYYWLWPGPRWTLTPDTQNKLAGTAKHQPESAATDQLKIDETTEKAQPLGSSNNPIALAPPDKVNDTRKKAAPTEELAVTDGQPKIFIAKASPAPDPLPHISEVGGGVTAPGKTEAEAPANAVLATKPEPNTAPPPKKETVAQKAPPSRNTDPGTDGQAAIPAAGTAPEPAPSTDTPVVGSPVTAAGKAAAAMVAVLAAEPGPKAGPAPRKETVVQDSPLAREVDTGADRQTAVPAAEAAPEPDASNDTPEVDSPVTAAGKAATAVVAVPAAKPNPKVDPTPRKKTVAQEAPPDRPGVESDATTPGTMGANPAAVVVLADAKPEPKAIPTPRKETAAPEAPPVREAVTGTDGQVSVSADMDAPGPAPSTGSPGVEGDTTTPGTMGANPAAVVVLVDAKPSSPVHQGTSVGNAGIKPKTDALKPSNAKGLRATESKSQTTVSQSKATAGENTPVEEVKSAKAETTLQSSSEVGVSTTASVEQLDINGLENRLRSFLQTYCNTYAAKDLDSFTNFFSANAMENGKSFYSLLPKYERNFKYIETIQYRIELQEFSVDESERIIKIDGDFFLKWLPTDKQWRKNSGKISMSLIENGSSFLVQRLDYQGGSVKKK